MRAAFVLGWILMLAAFAAAGAESISRGLVGERTWFLSAHQLWKALWPGSYLFFEVRAGDVAPWLWDPLIMTLLAPPAYLLLGVPGVILAWTCRPGRELTPQEQEEFEEHAASLFLYDELSREAKRWARETGEDPNVDDRMPTEDLIDLFEKGPDDEDDEFLRDLDNRLPPAR